MSFNFRIRSLEQQIGKKKRELEKYTMLEKRSREKWTKSYHAYMMAATQLTEITHHGTKREAGLHGKIRGWPKLTTMLTKARDGFRIQIDAVREELIKLGTEFTKLVEQQTGDANATDEIVTQVFELNNTVVRAAGAREDCLNRHVFPRLIDEHGKLSSQVSFTSSNGLRRVVAMVNTMTIVSGDMAGRAMAEIQRFFDRFKQEAEMDANLRALYELTRQLLVEKTSFKVGPDLYRFIAMTLDAGIFPELSTAQHLLRQSIRSEKTTSYIRLYARPRHTDAWEVVRQS